MRNERRSLEQLQTGQTEPLRRLIRHAYEHVPYYREMFSGAGLKPDDIRNASDLTQLPLLDKTALRDRPIEDFLDRRVDPSTLIVRHTSGSSGVPLKLYANQAYEDFCKAQYLRPYFSNGRSVFDRVLRLTVTPSPKPTWFQRLGLMREQRIIGDARPDTLRQIFLREEPHILQGYPSRIVSLAEALQRDNVEFRAPKFVFTDSELLSPDARQSIEQTFRAPVYDVFGSFETDNIGHECDRHAGYHLAIDCVVPEIIADNRPARPGETGELVCTVLYNFAMPLIRYRLGDAAALSDVPCECGRGLPIMSVVEGRVVDYVVWPDGTRESPMQFLSKFDRMSDIARQYQIVQTAHDRFRVLIVPHDQLLDEHRRYVEAAIRAQCATADVEIRAVENIDYEKSGKHRAFRCEVGN